MWEFPFSPITFDFEKNEALLRTETPGPAIWSAFIDPDPKALSDRLAALAETADTDLYRYNLGIALGIIGDKRALPILREIVQNRDCFYFKDCRRSNQFRSAIALCLIGRIGEEEDVACLREIVFDPGEIKRPLYHTLKPDYLYHASDDRNFVFFALFTHAAASLVKLTKRLGLPSASLSNELTALKESGRALSAITSRPADSPVSIETCDFLAHLIEELNSI